MAGKMVYLKAGKWGDNLADCSREQVSVSGLVAWKETLMVGNSANCWAAPLVASRVALMAEMLGWSERWWVGQWVDC